MGVLRFPKAKGVVITMPNITLHLSLVSQIFTIYYFNALLTWLPCLVEEGFYLSHFQWEFDKIVSHQVHYDGHLGMKNYIAITTKQPIRTNIGGGTDGRTVRLESVSFTSPFEPLALGHYS